MTITEDVATATMSADERAHPIRWDRWFVVIAVLFGLFFAIATPPLQEHDAAAHIVRLDQISRGVILQPLDGGKQATVELDGCTRGFIVHHSARGERAGPMDFAANWSAVRCGEPGLWGISNSALTSPVPYVPLLIGYGGAKLVGGGMNVRELAARITNLACYIAVVWLALRLATKGRALLFAVALLPSSLALASGLHPDALGIATAILAVALVLRLREQPSRVLLAALAVDLVVVALCKNLYSPLVLLLLLVPAAAFASKRQRWAYVAGTAAVGLLTTVLWLSQVSKIHYRLDMLNIDSKASTTWITHHPFGFLHQVWNGLWDPFIRHVTLPGLVEVLGGLRPSRTAELAGDLVPLPVALLAIAVLVVAVHADPGPAGVRRSRDRVLVLAVTLTCAVGCVLLILFGLALTANAPGASTITSVQGRYLLPVIPLAAFAAGRRVQTAAVPRVVPAGTLFFLLWVTARFFVVFY